MLKEKNKITNCHCERSEAISQKIATPYGLAMTESGRSMVEMLGVLAVIGVLSVAGIAGYNNAMNKHRANELLNEASKRAAIVAMQATASQNLSINEFLATNEKLGFTGVQENPANTQQFQLTLSEVDEKVCTQMRSSVGTNTPIRDINSDCTVITYNKDLSTTQWASDFKDSASCTGASKKWCSKIGSGTCVEDDCCSVQNVSICQTCVSSTGALTNKIYSPCDSDDDGTFDGYCDKGICKNENLCIDNEDCSNLGGIYYCKYPASSLYNADENVLDAMKCTGSTLDTCERVGVCTEIKSSEYVEKYIYGFNKTLRKSTKSMNWWSARSWCQAQSKETGMSWDLLDIGNNRLGCYNNPIAGKCCNSTTPNCDGSYDGQSPNMAGLTNSTVGFGPNGQVWTKTKFNTSSTPQFYYIDLTNGELMPYYPYLEYQPICE